MRQKVYWLLPLFAVVLYCNSCNLPAGPGYGEGTLTLLLPETAVQNRTAGASRSVLSDTFTGGLAYRLTFTGPGATRTMEAGGGGTTVSLEAGVWNISAEAYDPAAPAVPVGSGSAAITVIAGRNSSVRIPMTVDPAYEALLTDIYIHSEADLRRVHDLAVAMPARFFYLERDIVVNNWMPIGDSGTPFDGIFDGQGHSVTINSFADTTAEYLGLFGYTYGAGIKNLNMVCNLGNAEFPLALGTGSAYSHVGALVGKADTTNIENITVAGSLYFSRGTGGNETYFGGIAGSCGNSNITSCRVNAELSLETTAGIVYAGGAAGFDNGNSIIEKSSFTGNIYAEGVSMVDAGGMAGSFSGSVTSCYVSGTVYANSSNTSACGGIVGAGSGSAYIEKCYAWVNVSAYSYDSGASYAGGIAGGLNSGGIEQCYSRGTVDAYYAGSSGHAGGIAGYNASGTIEYCAVLHDYIIGFTDQCGIAGYSTGGTYSKNYTASELIAASSLPEITVYNDQNGFTPALNSGQNYTDFQGSSSTMYDTSKLNWNFPGDWKWLSSYDYPVLEWQTSPPPDGPPPPQ